MSNTYTPPLISVAYDIDEDCHVLMATSHQRTAIAGERILRAEPWPAIRWKHPTAEGAETDAATLRLYLDECASGKRKDTGKPVSKPHWED